MIGQICKYLRNWFEAEKLFGTFAISNGVITYADGKALPLLNGQYFRIIGSVFNDGVFQYPPLTNPEPSLKDETFEGAVWAMAVPQDILDLADEIAEWVSKYGGADSTVNSPYSSESFDGYSYSKASGGGSGSASAPSAGDWRSVYGSRLADWRRLI